MSNSEQAAAAGLRADARLNQSRVLDAAGEAFAQYGFTASYHEIARVAGVGVGTVYRRFPHRDALVEAVLLSVLSGLTDAAVAATEDLDAWTAFESFFRVLAGRMHRHAGLSSQIDVRSSAKVDAARADLLDAVARLCTRAAPHLRSGIDWQDVIFLAQLSVSNGCGLGVEVTERRSELAIEAMLEGIRRTRI